MRRPLFACALTLCTAVASADPPAAPSAPAPAAPSPSPTQPAAQPAAPSVGTAVGLPRAPEFSLESTTGATRRLRDFSGRVVIVLYEDRDSNQQNNDLKRELAEHARTEDLTRDVSLVPVANLSAYNFWPARGYARDAVVEIAREQGYEIMIDWTGDMARAYRFRPGVSHALVVGRDGRVLFRAAGALSPRFRRNFFEAISAAIHAPR